MKDDFMADMDVGSPREFGGDRVPRIVGVTPEDPVVPGMGDEPVMCPFCDKPLPPVLFTSHSHKPNKPEMAIPNRPRGLSRSATIHSVPTRNNAVASSQAVNSATNEPKLLEALPVLPSTTSSALGIEVSEADQASTRAGKSLISEEDLRRWSRLAGITMPSQLNKQPTQADEDAKVIPKLAPPPPPASSSRLTETRPQQPSRTASASRFNPFKGKDITTDDDESDDEGGGAGYAKLTGDASDSDDEGGEKAKDKVIEKEVLRDEPEEIAESRFEPQADIEEKQRDAAVESQNPVSNDDLRQVLQEVLGKIGGLVSE